MQHKKIEAAFKDERGWIADILYKARVEHVAVIRSKAGVLRGNHYHAKTIQHVYVVQGSLRYYWKSLWPPAERGEVVILPGCLATSPPNEIHAMYFLEPCTMLVFSEGARGGVDYESDTFRETIVTLEEARGAA